MEAQIPFSGADSGAGLEVLEEEEEEEEEEEYQPGKAYDPAVDTSDCSDDFAGLEDEEDQTATKKQKTNPGGDKKLASTTW